MKKPKIFKNEIIDDFSGEKDDGFNTNRKSLKKREKTGNKQNQEMVISKNEFHHVMNVKNFNICSLLSQNQVYIGTSIGEIETFNLFNNSFKKENIVIDESKN